MPAPDETQCGYPLAHSNCGQQAEFVVAIIAHGKVGIPVNMCWDTMIDLIDRFRRDPDRTIDITPLGVTTERTL